MKVYKCNRFFKVFSLVMAAITFAISVGVFIEHENSLKKWGVILMLWSMSSVILIAAFRYRVILGEDYIERVEYRCVRIPLQEITRVLVLFNQARVYSSQKNIHIGGNTENFGDLIGRLLQSVATHPGTEILGDLWAIDDFLESAQHRETAEEKNVADASAIRRVDLMKKGWLKRCFAVHTQAKVYEVVYNGRGMGYESVLVDGRIASLKYSYFWYIPEFKFRVAEFPCIIKVRVWPWLTIRSFTLEIAGTVVYKE